MRLMGTSRRQTEEEDLEIIMRHLQYNDIEQQIEAKKQQNGAQ